MMLFVRARRKKKQIISSRDQSEIVGKTGLGFSHWQVCDAAGRAVGFQWLRAAGRRRWFGGACCGRYCRGAGARRRAGRRGCGGRIPAAVHVCAVRGLRGVGDRGRGGGGRYRVRALFSPP